MIDLWACTIEKQKLSLLFFEGQLNQLDKDIHTNTSKMPKSSELSTKFLDLVACKFWPRRFRTIGQESEGEYHLGDLHH